MTVMTQIILAVALVLSIIVPFGYYFIGEKSRGRYKTTIATNAFFFFGTMLVAAMVMFAGSSSVQAATGADAGIATGLGYIAAALVTGLSCIGGGIAVASAASAALGAISEDQSILGKSLIFVGPFPFASACLLTIGCMPCAIPVKTEVRTRAIFARIP